MKELLLRFVQEYIQQSTVFIDREASYCRYDIFKVFLYCKYEYHDLK